MALEDALADEVSAEDETDDEAEADDVVVDEDALALGVAVGVGVEPVEGEDEVLGVDEVDGVEVLVEVLGVSDGVVAGWVACVVVGAAGTVKVARGSALVPWVLGSADNDASEASDESELTDVFGAAADELPSAEVVVPAAVVPVVAATLTCEDGVCVVTGTEMAEAWAG